MTGFGDIVSLLPDWLLLVVAAICFMAVAYEGLVWFLSPPAMSVEQQMEELEIFEPRCSRRGCPFEEVGR